MGGDDRAWAGLGQGCDTRGWRRREDIEASLARLARSSERERPPTAQELAPLLFVIVEAVTANDFATLAATYRLLNRLRASLPEGRDWNEFEGRLWIAQAVAWFAQLCLVDVR